MRAVLQYYFTARLGRFARAQMSQHQVTSQYALNQDFHFAATGLLAKHAGGYHACIVEHQEVPRTQQRWKITKPCIAKRLLTLHDQQAAAAPLSRWPCGD